MLLGAKKHLVQVEPRIKVRFFAGYNFEGSNLNDQDLIQEAYSKNIPMGGDMIQEKGKNPRFLVWAISDPLEHLYRGFK